MLPATRDNRIPVVPPLNYIRTPALGAGLLLLLFLPGIIHQGQQTYLSATGQTQQPYLDRWLLLTAAMFTLSAVIYATITARRRPVPRRRAATATTDQARRASHHDRLPYAAARRRDVHDTCPVLPRR